MLKDKTVIIGTIGSDIHLVGQFIIYQSLKEAGFNAFSLGSSVGQEEFINAAIETKADAIFISSLYGMGLFDCAGMKDKCIEAGLENILLYIGGRLTTGDTEWDEIESKYKELGFDRVYPPDTSPEQAIIDLKTDLKLAEGDK